MADQGQPWSHTHRLVDDRGEFFAATCTCGWYSPERADPDEVDDARDLHDREHVPAKPEGVPCDDDTAASPRSNLQERVA